MKKNTNGWEPGKKFPHCWGTAQPFIQHAFQKTVALLSGLPRVLITRAAYQKMLAIVDIADKEVGWLGTTRKVGSDFLIEEIFLFKQEVSSVTTEISPEGLAEVAQELLTTRPDGMEVCNNLRFWGHSHVRMGTSPSGQDESQMATFRESGHPWFIRGIFNKEGRAEFTIFLYDAGVKVVDAEWAISEPVDDSVRAEIEAEFSAKVSEKNFFVHTPLTPGFSGVPMLERAWEERQKIGGDDGERKGLW